MEEQKNKTELELIKELLLNWLRHWYYFVISFIICAVIGYAYFKVKTPVYSTVSKLIVEPDQGLGGSISRSPSLMSSFFGGGGSGVNIEDESNKMGSYGSLIKVISRLRLNNEFIFSEYGGLWKKELYKQSPVNISYSPAMPDTLSAYLTFDFAAQHGKYKITMKANQEKVGNYELSSLPGKIQTPYGEFGFEQTPTYALYGNSFKLKINVLSYDLQTQLYKDMVVVDFPKKSSDILLLEVVSPDPRKAVDILNEVTQVYNEEWVNDKDIVAKKTIDYIESRLVVTKESLEMADENIRKFKKENNLTDPVVDATVFLERTGDLEGKLLEAQTQLKITDIIDDFMSDPRNEYVPIPFSLSVTDQTMAEAIVAYNEVLAERNETVESSGEQTTAVTSLNNQIKLRRQNIMQSLENVKKGMQIMVNDLEKKESEFTRKIGSIPSVEKEYVKLKREQELQLTVFTYLLEKREETLVKAVSLMPRLKVIDKPHTVITPISPNLMKIALGVVFLGGIILPISAISLKPYLRRSRKK